MKRSRPLKTTQEVLLVHLALIPTQQIRTLIKTIPIAIKIQHTRIMSTIKTSILQSLRTKKMPFSIDYKMKMHQEGS